MRKNRLWVFIIAIFFYGSCSLWGFRIVNDGWRDDPNTTIFDPCNPPAVIVPYNLDPNEAITIPQVNIRGAAIEYTYTNGCLVVVDLSDICISGQSNIYEPMPPDSDQHDHEVGHDKLNRFEFMKNAERKLMAEMQGFKGKTFCEPTKEAAKVKAMAERDQRFKQAKFNLKTQMQALGDKYDSNDLTNHNKNESITPDEAVEAVKAGKDKVEKKKKQPRAGAAEIPASPPLMDPLQIVSDPAAFLRFKAANAGAIMFDPIIPDFNGINPSDTLHNRLKLIIGELVRLGKLPDTKKQGFVDKTVKFVDSLDPNIVYLQGAIFEITYEPSNRPGFNYMLHGVFDVWPGEINNAIGSAWLSAMHEAATKERECGFWMYFNEPLFDEDGEFIVGPAPVPCEIAFGAAVYDNIVITEDFDDYIDSAQLQAGWQTTPGGLVMLDPNAVDGRQSMLLEYNTLVEPFVEATRMYMPPQNWQMSGKSHFELWFNTDGFDPNVIDRVYVKVQGGGMTGTCELAMNSQVYLGQAEAGYAAAAIPLDVFMAAGVNLNMVESVTVGVARAPAGGEVSALRIDAMRLSQGEYPAAPTADLDDDYKVNMSDLAIMAQQWLDGE